MYVLPHTRKYYVYSMPGKDKTEWMFNYFYLYVKSFFLNTLTISLTYFKLFPNKEKNKRNSEIEETFIGRQKLETTGAFVCKI